MWRKEEKSRLKAKAGPGTRRTDFDKLPLATRNEARATSIETYKKNLSDAKKNFPNDGFPVFLELGVDENSDVYQKHWKQWVKLRRDLKVSNGLFSMPDPYF